MSAPQAKGSYPDAKGARLGSGLIRIFGKLDLEVWGYEQVGPEEFERVVVHQDASGAMIDLPITIVFRPGLVVGAVEAAGGATIDFETSSPDRVAGRRPTSDLVRGVHGLRHTDSQKVPSLQKRA